MKKVFSLGLIVLFAALVSCELEEYEVRCFPTRVISKINAGASSYTLTADYKYDGERVDYIIISTGQTHYFDYSGEGTLEQVRKIDVRTKQKEELRLLYEGEQLVRIDEYVMNLNPLTHEDRDTSYVRYHLFEYDGKRISMETIYARDKESGEFVLVTRNEVAYDNRGNLVEYSTTDVRSQATTTYSFEYDAYNNPFQELELYFTGESYVNNILHKEEVTGNTEYTYQVMYNDDKYPDQIIEKQDGVISQVINFEYFCK